MVAQSMSELSVKPAKAVTSWLTDQIAPAYWKPNSVILVSDTRSPTLGHPPPPSANHHQQPTQHFPVQGCVYCLSLVLSA